MAREREISGGGELIDQGVHLIDLSRWFLGDFTTVAGLRADLLLGHAGRRQRVPDAAHREGPDRVPARERTEWKNTFSLEIYGRVGKLHIDGLGGSYGTEKLTWYQMLPEMGPPETTAWEYPMADDSWSAEFAEFLEEIQARRQAVARVARRARRAAMS